ncbi:hypothetical protein ANCDUO_00077 [Ancylostoma duodenale]|uniref:Uncharacterized protein n=1 Tax=Ancylostoma duodenale TaxID=51022 RepID=A0A0C2E2C1_9BILA|nr:hypothetical protein ANCDUO_00077 [Ancylostoma duodenale]
MSSCLVNCGGTYARLGLDLENTNAHDADDDRSTKASDWSSKDWRDQTGSDGSSGVESPPSDIPTSSSSLYNPPKIYNEFVKKVSGAHLKNSDSCKANNKMGQNETLLEMTRAK